MHTSLRAKLFTVLKGLGAVVFFALVVMILPNGVYAQGLGSLGLNQASGAIGLGGGNLTLMIASILRAFFALLGIIAVGIVVWGGFVWMTAGGAEEKVAEAKRIIRNGVIGMGVILLSFSIAQFVISALVGATTGDVGGDNGLGGGGIPQGFVGGGELGQTIEYVLPTPGATDVSRDTSIVVQFKKSIVVGTLLKNPQKATALIVHGDLNTDNIKVFQKKLGASSALTTNELSATVLQTIVGAVGSQTQKTMLVISPKPGILLGSPNENIEYTVALGTGVQQDDPATGISALFSNKNGYNWSFTAGTKVDLVPPKILNVYPSPGTKDNYTNAVVTVNFDKPMLPSSILDTTISGLKVLDKSGNEIKGTWDLANMASSAEFKPDNPCGKSACGDEFFCLPSNMAVDVHALPAALDPARGAPKALLGGAGLMSLNQNSFDGNGNGTAEGPDKDSADYKFDVGSKLDTEGPTITAHTPGLAESEVNPEGPMSLVFSEPLLMSSIGGVALDQPEGLAQYYFPHAEDIDSSGNAISGNDAIAAATKIMIEHAPFLTSTTSTIFEFKPRVDEKVKDRQNNCYLPGIGLGDCKAGMTTPYCCNGKVVGSASSCAEQYKSGKK